MDRREDLLNAATALLDEGGPDAVTLRDVGRNAGVSHNAPYRHFRDKADLLASIAARELNRRGRSGGEDGEEGPAEVEDLMRRYVRWALDYPERFRLTFGRWERDHPGLATAAEDARAELLEAVRRAQSRGRLPKGPSERLAALVHAATHGAATLALTGHLAADGKGGANADDLVEDFFKYLRVYKT